MINHNLRNFHHHTKEWKWLSVVPLEEYIAIISIDIMAQYIALAASAMSILSEPKKNDKGITSEKTGLGFSSGVGKDREQ